MKFLLCITIFSLICDLNLIEIVNALPIIGQNLEFILVHNNDLHSRFEETDKNSNKCSDDDAKANQCYGGFARISYLLKSFREKSKLPRGKPVIYLNAGDTYSGTVWFTIFKDKIASDFMNILKPDAMSLGNHEFDKSVKGLVPFLNTINFPIVASNLDLKKVPDLQNHNSLHKSIVITVNGYKIGIIGYLTPDTEKTSSIGNVEILPEIESINKEAERLKRDGVKVIIALGHSGFEADKLIALYCPDVDIVVGGHTNTFLYNGEAPDVEIPSGTYPVVMIQSNGKRVPVVQAYAFGKYLGYLRLKFDPNGDLLDYSGNPILIDSSIPQDPEVLKLLDVYRPNISALSDIVVGTTQISLDGSRGSCRKNECSMGDVLADSMVYARERQLNTKSDAVVAFLNSGGIRASIEKKSDGAITSTDVLNVIPFNNPLYMKSIKGDKILSALELSANNYYRDDLNGGFLQMAGVKVKYDMSRPTGQRVIDVKILNSDTNQFEPLDLNKNYNVIFTKFLLKGGDGYKWSEDIDPLDNAKSLETTDSSATIQYIRDKGPLTKPDDNRITLI